jgi:acyl phosphate:glycerol-3-phosphate acyltransferase
MVETIFISALRDAALYFLLGYLLGSIPFGLLLTRVAGLGDIRDIGSKNIGATNVLRTGRKDLAIATLLADALKGTAAVLIAWRIGGTDLAVLTAGLGAFLGHVFPVWLRFKGGKGVATYIGVLIAISWPVALAFGAIWLIVAFISRYSSLAALVASAATPFILIFASGIVWAALFAAMSIILIAKHHANIRRLMSGTETRIGKNAAPVSGG